VRIVLTTFGSYGDLHPFLALALELKRRGHDAVIATSAFYRDKVVAEGVEFAAVPPDLPDGADPAVMRNVFDPRNGPEYLVRRLVMPCLRESYAALAAACEGADLLVAHTLTFAAPLVAEKQNLPWASAVLAPMAFFSAYDPPVLPPLPWLNRLRRLGPPLFGPLFRLLRGVTRPWTAAVGDLRREIGLAAARLDPMYGGQFSPQLNLALFSPLLASPQPDWPANTVVAGFAFYDREQPGEGMSPALAAFLDAGPPPVVFTLGSAAVGDARDFFTQSAEAAQLVGRRAILLIGHDPRNRLTTPQPDTIAVAEYAPFSDLFPRAAAVVHQGGIGTTGQALRAGRPALVVPFGFDQPDNAERAARLGVARVIARHRYSAATAASALRALLADATCIERAEEVGKTVQAESGAERACDSLESMLAARSR
jgi:rhamnosyltransferase subunit B